MNTQSDKSNQPINESTIDQLRNKHQSKTSHFSPNKAAVSFIFIIVLMVGLAAGLIMIKNQKSTQTDSKAFGGVDLTLTTTLTTNSTNLNAGDPFVVNVLMNPNNERVSAIELHLDYDQSKFEIDTSKAIPFTKEGYFTQVLPNCKADPSSSPCPSTHYIDTVNGIATLYLGSSCSDNGTPNDTTDDTCDTPSPTTTQIVIAKLYLKAKTTASGTGSIKFKMPTSGQDYQGCITANGGEYVDACEGTWVASLGNEGNRSKQELFAYTLPINIQVSGACEYDFNNANGIDIQDILTVASRYGAVVGDPNYNPIYDFNNANGIDIQDILTVAQHFGATCN